MGNYKTKKRDKNHIQIENELRQLGFSVVSTHILGGDVPDIIASIYGVTIWIEVKSKGGKPTTGQVKFQNEWQGLTVVAYNTVDIVRLILEHLTKENEKSTLMLRYSVLLFEQIKAKLDVKN